MTEDLSELNCKVCGHYWSSDCEVCSPDIDPKLKAAIKEAIKNTKPIFHDKTWITGYEDIKDG